MGDRFQRRTGDRSGGESANKYQNPSSGYDLNRDGPNGNDLLFEFRDTSGNYHNVLSSQGEGPAFEALPFSFR